MKDTHFWLPRTTTPCPALPSPAPPRPPVATYVRMASSDSVSKRTAVVDEKARTKGGCPVAGSAGDGVGQRGAGVHDRAPRHRCTMA